MREQRDKRKERRRKKRVERIMRRWLFTRAVLKEAFVAATVTKVCDVSYTFIHLASPSLLQTGFDVGDVMKLRTNKNQVNRKRRGDNNTNTLTKKRGA